jgi:solute carrier family 25 folate transporter 32
MHPLDLVKVRFQLSEHPSSSSLKGKERAITSPTPRFGTGVYRALEDAVKVDGWRGLYRGLGPNIVGGASSWGLYFLL